MYAAVWGGKAEGAREEPRKRAGFCPFVIPALWFSSALSGIVAGLFEGSTAV